MKLLKIKTRSFVLIIAAVFVAGALVGFGLYHYDHTNQATVKTPPTTMVCNCINEQVGANETPGPGPCHCPE